MYKVRIQNFRSLKDTGYIDIKPLTVLVGKNSSGKSTFLRFFPLLRQSFEKRVSSPVLFSGDLEKDYVDFGGFKQAILKNQDVEEIIFSLSSETRIPIRPFFPNYLMVFSIKTLTDTEIHIKSFSDGKGEYVSSLCLQFFGYNTRISFDESGSYKIYINNSDYTHLTKDILKIDNKTFVPQFINIGRRLKKNTNYVISNSENVAEEKIVLFEREIYKKIKSFFKQRLHQRTSDSKIDKVIKSINLNTPEKVLNQIKNFDTGLSSFVDLVNEWTIDNTDFRYFVDLVVLHSLGDILERIFDAYEIYFRRCYYIAPVRAYAARSYVQQGIAVNEIDYNGNNLAMFLYSLDESRMNSLKHWTKNNFGFEPDIQVNDGRITIYIKNETIGGVTNLADMGFGYSQILPVIVQLWSLCEYSDSQNSNTVTDKFITSNNVKKESVFVIEQPELHLHPALQAKLLDTFIIALSSAMKNNNNLSIIIETHSSAIIERIGYNIENGKILNDDVNIVIFDKNENNVNSEISIGSFDSQGYLDNWPLGFFSPEEV